MKFHISGYTIDINKKLLSDDTIPTDLKEALAVIERYGLKTVSTSRQRASAKNATALRTNKAKEKIINAINLIRLENKPLTMYQVSKVSGCSINTVRKYKELIVSAEAERER